MRELCVDSFAIDLSSTMTAVHTNQSRSMHRMREFLRARFSAESWLGLHLTIGALVLVTAAWIFADLAEDVITADRITVVDVLLVNWLHAHASAGVIRAMLVVSALHGIAAIAVMSAAFAAYLGLKRQRDWLLLLVLAAPGGMLLNAALKLAFARTRPHFVDPIVNLTTYSFPSGHVAGSTLFYGVLAGFMIARVRSNPVRMAIVVIVLLLVALVATSRMVLGAHFLSDVLAGFVESVAWLAVCVTGVSAFSQRRAERASQQ